MRVIRIFFFAGLFLSYIYLCTIQEQWTKEREVYLDYALPSNIQKVTAGYVKQLAAEMLFVRTSVFLGGVKPGRPPSEYVDALGNNFEIMTQLYPQFMDPYFFCQGFLSPISHEAAVKTNRILETGIAIYPQDQVLRFFYASNFFLAMDEPRKAAVAFNEAAKLENATPLFAHLAALLSAQGGDIAAGIISLKALLASENTESVRARYEEEIAIFEQAIAVQAALNSYNNKYGTSPGALGDLVPEFLPQLPEIKNSFSLVYDPPTLRLQRPDRRKKDDSLRK